jgi:hypothetical protein
MILRSMPAVVLLLVGCTMLDMSEVMTQTKKIHWSFRLWVGV